MINIPLLLTKAIQYDRGDAKRIQHLIKVHSLSSLIGTMEGLDPSTQNILEAAAILHDIGIHVSEQKYGNCNGKNQELEGPPIAKKLLTELSCAADDIERICYLIAHHHTYDSIQGMDYQILVEADFLVNLYEDGAGENAIKSAKEKIFKTKSGRKICEMMYNI